MNQQKLAENTNDDAETKRCYFKQARNYFEETLRIYNSLQVDKFHWAMPLGNLGELLVKFGEFEKQQQNSNKASELFGKAIEVLSDGLNISEQQGFLKGKNITFKNLIKAKA